MLIIAMRLNHNSDLLSQINLSMLDSGLTQLCCYTLDTSNEMGYSWVVYDNFLLNLLLAFVLNLVWTNRMLSEWLNYPYE